MTSTPGLHDHCDGCNNCFGALRYPLYSMSHGVLAGVHSTRFDSPNQSAAAHSTDCEKRIRMIKILPCERYYKAGAALNATSSST